MQLEIKMKPVNEIIPYWRNPRRNDATVDALVEEIEKRGFNVPIVIDKNNVVVKGHARLRAAKRLGMQEVPCIVSEAPEEVIRADRIADNKIQELSSWDYGKLDLELDKLGDGMEFKKLFRPEDSVKLEEEEIPEIEYKPAGLDFWDGGYEGEERQEQQFGFGNVAPRSTEVHYDHPDIPIQVDLGDAGPKPETATPQKRTLKTLCPYCGKVVMLTL